jgi:hypothetical protein
MTIHRFWCKTCGARLGEYDGGYCGEHRPPSTHSARESLLRRIDELCPRLDAQAKAKLLDLRSRTVAHGFDTTPASFLTSFEDILSGNGAMCGVDRRTDAEAGWAAHWNPARFDDKYSRLVCKGGRSLYDSILESSGDWSMITQAIVIHPYDGDEFHDRFAINKYGSLYYDIECPIGYLALMSEIPETAFDVPTRRVSNRLLDLTSMAWRWPTRSMLLQPV